ncbi:MAG: sugar phosphate isomerase/epimerase [Lentisphaeria bacterium]|nr:sugar phosphate isomerase/epimerase [Lentisphaeria bacterium]
MKIAINTDYCSGTGSPELPLRYLAEAGFTHVHWCHQWCTDFLYGKAEIEAISGWLRELGLTLLDIHGSAGVEKCWYSTVEYQRRAGVELVRNRLEMFTELGGTGALMMHIPCFQAGQSEEQKTVSRRQFDALRRSLDELMPDLERRHVPVAVENMWGDYWTLIRELLDAYPPELLGITYDSGHANADSFKQMELLEQCRDRLQALHLNDNDGSGDLHQPPCYGTVEWERLAEILAASSYNREPSFELAMRCTPYFDPGKKEQTPEAIRAFLENARLCCERFAERLRAHKDA